MSETLPIPRFPDVRACLGCLGASVLAILVDPWLEWRGGQAPIAFLPGILLGGALVLPQRLAALYLSASAVSYVLLSQIRDPATLGDSSLRAALLLFEVSAGVAMAHWLSKPALRLGRPGTVVLLGLALPIGLPLAFQAGLSLAAGDLGEFWRFGSPWMADAAGFLIGTPVILLLRRVPPRRATVAPGWEEMLVCLLIFATLSGALIQPEPARLGLVFLVLPFISWELVRHSPVRAVLATLVSAALFSGLGAAGLGPFGGPSSWDRLVELQLFLGTSGWLLWSGILVRFSSPEPRGSTPSDRADTEEEPARWQLEHELLRTDKMHALGSLVTGIAHEINNPNQFISLNAPLLRDIWREVEPILDEHDRRVADFRLASLTYTEMRTEIPQLIDEISQGSQRIRQIVSELRRYVSRESPVTQQPIDLNRVVDSALTLLHSTIRKSTQRFEVEVCREPLMILGSFARLQQVVINLLLNACQALVEPSSRLRVETGIDDASRCATITIIDRGVGIAAELLPRITHPFFTTKREGGATGLGLAVAARIVAAHDGRLDFHSRVGEGTTVTLSLPLLPRRVDPLRDASSEVAEVRR